MNAIPLTLPFSTINKDSLPLVGGKGANLGEMTQAGFPRAARILPDNGRFPPIPQRRLTRFE